MILVAVGPIARPDCEAVGEGIYVRGATMDGWNELVRVVDNLRGRGGMVSRQSECKPSHGTLRFYQVCKYGHLPLDRKLDSEERSLRERFRSGCQAVVDGTERKAQTVLPSNIVNTDEFTSKRASCHILCLI